MAEAVVEEPMAMEDGILPSVVQASLSGDGPVSIATPNQQEDQGSSSAVAVAQSIVLVPAGDSREPEDMELQCPYKKLKLDGIGGSGIVLEDSASTQPSRAPKIEKLENRLVSLLCCTVCLDLPKASIYQCTNGHLMCAGCFSHLLADARLRDEVATCPNCRVEINKHTATRNLAVEKAVNELPSECQYCNFEFPRNTLEHHERELCEERTMNCKYGRIGCPWRGPFHELNGHEISCTHPSKTGEEVMGVLRGMDQSALVERKFYRGLFDLLSIEKVQFNDLQFKPYRTDEFVHKLYYETSRFTAFSQQWVVKARINANQRDPTQSAVREMTYQLIVKSKPTSAMDVSFLILKGPFGDMKVNPGIYHFNFTETNCESPSFVLPLVDSVECNRLLACKTIHFRLIASLQ